MKARNKDAVEHHGSLCHSRSVYGATNGEPVYNTVVIMLNKWVIFDQLSYWRGIMSVIIMVSTVLSRK